MNVFLRSVAGGFMIGMGGIVYLSCQNVYIGAFLFSLGLLTICEFGLGLFTGKVGYIIINKGDYWKEVLITLLGNVFGTLLAGILANYSKTDIVEKTGLISADNLSQGLMISFVLSVFCGILMFIAVNIYKSNSGIGKYIGIFTAVPVFILSGFEHSIANMFYFFCAHIFNEKMIIFTIVCVLGNAIGSFLIAYFVRK